MSDLFYLCGICLPAPVRVFLTICYGSMTIFGGTGNVISIISIYKKNKNPNDRDKIDQILLSLAVCDVLASLTVYPLYPWLNFWNHSLSFDHFPNRLFGVLVLSLTSVSSLTMIMLASIKYIKISKFQRFDDIITEYRLRILIISTWILSILAMSSNLYDKRNVWLVNQISFAIICITLVALPVFYFLILFVYRQSRKNVRNMIDSIAQQESADQTTAQVSKKLIRRSLWLIGVYFACTLLTIFSMTLHPTGLIKHGYLYQATNIIFLGNSCANPCIYMYKDKKIRKIAKGLFKRSQAV